MLAGASAFTFLKGTKKDNKDEHSGYRTDPFHVFRDTGYRFKITHYTQQGRFTYFIYLLAVVTVSIIRIKWTELYFIYNSSGEKLNVMSRHRNPICLRALVVSAIKA